MYKFLQLNIWFGGNLSENALAFFDKEKPDIIALQEVTMPMALEGYVDHPSLNFIQKVKDTTGCKHSIFVPEFAFRAPTLHNNDLPLEWGIMILSRFPLLGHEYTSYINEYAVYDWEDVNDYSILHKGILVAKIDLDGKLLHVATTHGVWGTDDKDNSDRLKMSSAIVTAIEDKKPLLLSGDLNVDQNTETIRNIEEHVTNAFRDTLETTFNMRHKDPSKGTFGSSIVDFVFASQDIKVLSAYSPEDNVSDHVPLIVEFELPEAPL